MKRAGCRMTFTGSASLCAGALLAAATASMAAPADISPADGKGGASTAAQVAKPKPPSSKAGSAEKGAPPSGAGSAASRSASEKSFKDWTLQCLEDNSVEPRCQIIHQSRSPDKKQVLLVMSIAPIAKDKMGLQLALPLGFAIQSGVKLSFGPKFSTTAAVSRCTVQGCLVEGAVPSEMIAAMKKEDKGEISVQTVQGSTIKLDLGLNGFVAAYDAMLKQD